MDGTNEVSTRTGSGFNWMLGLAAVLALGLFAGGVYLAAALQSWVLLGAGALAVIGVMLVGAITGSIGSLNRAMSARVQPLEHQLDQIHQAMQRIGEQQLISDRAKAVAFRDRDRDAFRRAIHEDVMKQDYEAAIALADEMGRSFGYQAEAERLKAEVAEKRDMAKKQQIDMAVEVVESHIAAEQWQAAFREAERLRGAYPGNERVVALIQQIEGRRQAIKRQLQDRLLECDRAGNIDDGIAVLRKLDFYLTPVEASKLEETARHLFKRKLTQLGDGFRNSAATRDWNEAIRIANIIIADFPNTQMAKEAREMIPTLEQRRVEENSTEPVSV